jgi:hypothetical protein
MLQLQIKSFTRELKVQLKASRWAQRPDNPKASVFISHATCMTFNKLPPLRPLRLGVVIGLEYAGLIVVLTKYMTHSD